MKNLSEIIENRLNEIGITGQSAAKSVGLQPNFITDIVRGKKRSVSPHSVNQIAQALKWSVEEYYAATLPSFSEQNLIFTKYIEPQTILPLPVLGEARGGDEDMWQQIIDPRQWVTRPLELQHIQDAYAVTIVGDSMYPVLKSGYIACIAPNLTPHNGEIVVIQVELECGAICGLIKELVRNTETEVILKQYNPAKEITYEKSQVKTIHAVQSISLRRS